MTQRITLSNSLDKIGAAYVNLPLFANSTDWSKHIHTQYTDRTVTHINSTGPKCRMDARNGNRNHLEIACSVFFSPSLWALSLMCRRSVTIFFMSLHPPITLQQRPHEMCLEKSINRTKFKGSIKRAGVKFAGNGSPITKPSLRQLESNDLAHGCRKIQASEAR